MTALTPDAPASRPRRGEGHTPTVQSPPEDISPLPQSQPPPPPPQQTARATNQRRLTDEEIRDYLADRGAAAIEFLLVLVGSYELEKFPAVNPPRMPAVESRQKFQASTPFGDRSLDMARY